MQNDPNITLVTPDAPIATQTHGGRAKCLQRLVRLDLPVPKTVALSFESVLDIASGHLPNIEAILKQFPEDALLCVRPSSEDPDWGGPSAVLNIGMSTARFDTLCATLGTDAASSLFTRFVQSYAIHVERLDPDMFDDVKGEGLEALQYVLQAYEIETEASFPGTRSEQLVGVLKSMARAWEGTSARLLRQAKGAPADASLGLIVQQMAFGVGQGESGSGVLQLVSSKTGLPQITGRYLRQSQGRDALLGDTSLYISRDPRGPSFEELVPESFAKLVDYAHLMRKKLREEMQLEFTIESGELHILDGVRVTRSSRAAVRIAVQLALDEIILHQEALMRVDPTALNELLHRQVDRHAKRNVVGTGIAASPGAATGRLVFSANEAQASAARGEDCILVRRETSPEDIRGMHAAKAILTERGGVTSHAAVIGRGIGLPCVVGVSDIRFQTRKSKLVTSDGNVIQAGEIVTVDGTNGVVLLGAPAMQEAALDDAFQTLMDWADEERDIDIRANADTPADAQTARNFSAQGIGLCRTEHMFFEPGRRTVMREMIFAETSNDRRAVLERLLPMQRTDFIQLFNIM